MSKHTPGPWHVLYKAKYDEWHVSVPFDESAMKQPLFRDGIPTQNEFDAHLIAAAPDLLEALKMAMDHMDMLYPLGVKNGDALLNAMHNAIAKAEGKK